MAVLDAGSVAAAAGSLTCLAPVCCLQAHLEEVFETFAPASSGAGAAAGSADADGNSSTAGELLQLSLRYSFPQELVEKVGAPPTMWTVIRWEGGSQVLCCYFEERERERECV